MHFSISFQTTRTSIQLFTCMCIVYKFLHTRKLINQNETTTVLVDGEQETEPELNLPGKIQRN